MKYIIKTEELCRSFLSGTEKIYALRNINIEIEAGRLTVLRGRSGSGKTTLINLLGAIDRPDSGAVFFDNTDITKLTDLERDNLRRKQIGFVFQSGGLLNNLTAYENVELALRIVREDKSVWRSRTEQCLEMVGLGARRNHMPGELSGGEQQRVAIARAVAHRPKVIFADEPTAALDSAMGLQVVKVFKDLVQQEGITVIMTTHDPNMMEIADSVITLSDGELVNEG